MQQIADAVWEKETQGSITPRSISARDSEEFVKLLTEQKELLLSGLLTPPCSSDGDTKGSGPSFSHVLALYLREYGSGEFVARDGTNISKPSLNGGVSDDDVQGLILVFFEAFYDCLYDMPVLYSVQQVLETKYVPPKSSGDTLDIGTPPVPITSSLQWTNSPVFFTSAGAEPTAWGASVATRERVKSQATPITEKEAKAIQRLSKIAGKQAKSLTGTIFGFLSNVNVSVVVGADFAIGDNQTLLHTVQTIAEVSGRRSAEYAAYKALSQSRARSPEDLPIIDAIRAMED